MRASLLALLAFAVPLHATDVGTHVVFAGLPMDRRIELPAGARAGAVVWESGPSDPVDADFEAILFQGLLGGPGVAVEAAVKDGADWGAWSKAEGELSDGGRFWSKALISGRKGASVRLRAVADGTGRPAWIEFFGVYASDLAEERPGQGPMRVQSWRKTAAPAEGGAPKPDVLPRSAWGALPASKPYEPMVPERISVHHTEAPQPMTRDGAVGELQAIQRFHQHGRGWIDIAYHFLIDGGGRIWEGRPLTLVGAHVKDKNDGNVGISIMGDFSAGRDKPTAAQLKSLIALTRWLSETYAIPAERIVGHRDQEQ
ncbi:MAG: peptidoglycan recognition family protein, partial [Elusimicrobia bacterium]|nr:peptidoglycan recognition family protein [Elusimicrobiota bacterium]